MQKGRLVYVLESRQVEESIPKERLFDVRYQSVGGTREVSVQENSPSEVVKVKVDMLYSTAHSKKNTWHLCNASNNSNVPDKHSEGYSNTKYQLIVF